MIRVNKLLYHEIDYKDPLLIFNNFALKNWSMFLDSSDHAKSLNAMNRYSFIVFDPFIKITYKNSVVNLNGLNQNCINPFKFLNSIFKNYSFESIPDLPPFQGGMVGYFAYDLCHYLEDISYPQYDDIDFYDMAIGIYDIVISFDHELKKAWIVSSGLPEADFSKQQERAQDRINYTLAKIKDLKSLNSTTFVPLQSEQIRSNFTKQSYINAVEKVVEYIRAGDIFEANLSQRFKATLPTNFDTWGLYNKVRQQNSSPFAAYIKVNEIVIASTSPERFLLLKDSKIETRPIKGTCARSDEIEQDKLLAQSLKDSAKDNAENIMIVDLMRNDLSKICENGSISVPQLCEIETFAHVHHLVSVVTGKIRSCFNCIDLLEACFPGGSITGAPKIRSMQIIAELEKYRRGPYCGSIGYIGFDNTLDTSIIIRTFVVKNNVVTLHVGGAIVLDSDPAQEYQETIVKASALLDVLGEKENKD
jgi:para-aminobenzoate synthetase component 1